MKRKFLIKIIFILLLIVILLGLIIVNLKKIRNSEENFEYIMSNEMDKGTVSPSMIHVIVALYDGEVNPKSISKSTYYFVNTVIPRYQQNCSSKDDVESYYKKYKKDIYFDTGIDNKADFVRLIEKISEFGNSKIESSRFDKSYVIKTNTSLETRLYVKNNKNTEIGFKVIIENQESSTKPSIKYSVY